MSDYWSPVVSPSNGNMGMSDDRSVFQGLAVEHGCVFVGVLLVFSCAPAMAGEIATLEKVLMQFRVVEPYVRLNTLSDLVGWVTCVVGGLAICACRRIVGRWLRQCTLSEKLTVVSAIGLTIHGFSWLLVGALSTAAMSVAPQWYPRNAAYVLFPAVAFLQLLGGFAIVLRPGGIARMLDWSCGRASTDDCQTQGLPIAAFAFGLGYCVVLATIHGWNVMHDILKQRTVSVGDVAVVLAVAGCSVFAVRRLRVCVTTLQGSSQSESLVAFRVFGIFVAGQTIPISVYPSVLALSRISGSTSVGDSVAASISASVRPAVCCAAILLALRPQVAAWFVGSRDRWSMVMRFAVVPIMLWVVRYGSNVLVWLSRRLSSATPATPADSLAIVGVLLLVAGWLTWRSGRVED